MRNDCLARYDWFIPCHFRLSLLTAQGSSLRCRAILVGVGLRRNSIRATRNGAIRSVGGLRWFGEIWRVGTVEFVKN
jgi:hypothetical protein